jgi:hypothetical protein
LAAIVAFVTKEVFLYVDNVQELMPEQEKARRRQLLIRRKHKAEDR